MTDQNQKILLGISSCLLGEQVRFDGGHKNNAYINQTLGEYFRFKPFCPEVAIGLGIPREPIKLVKQSDTVQAIGVKNAALNVSQQLIECANEQRHWQDDIFGYIFKKDSPSCGMERVKIYIPDANRSRAGPSAGRRDPGRSTGRTTSRGSARRPTAARRRSTRRPAAGRVTRCRVSPRRNRGR